jgi:DNA topoisomerase I
MNIFSVHNPEEVAKELKSVSLRYVSDDIPGITREKKGKDFVYRKQDEVITDPHLIERIEKLAIPPAWEQIWIAPTGNGHIQATGRDAKGRKQYIYHQDWHKLVQTNKFNRMVFFGEILPDLRREITAGMQERGLTERRVISTVIWLLGKTYIRVGNEEYAEENQSYGLTTMRNKHVDVSGDTIKFEFKGKSGKFHSISVSHPRVAKTVKKLEELPGYELFRYIDDEGNIHTVESGSINEYLKKITGEEITAKDFRTWGGTVYAAESLYDEGNFTSDSEAKQKISQAVKLVSKHLGNTTTVCRAYYIHPTVIKSYESQELIPYFQEIRRDFAAGNNLTRNEYSVHRLLKHHNRTH